MRQPTSHRARDPRIDFLRGVSLLSIFVDHIPGNRLADYTLHNLGFSDAAELFVFLAGFSATMAYGRVFERDGMRTGLAKVAARCLKIYRVHVGLLLATLVIVAQWSARSGLSPVAVAPLLRDGVAGAWRGVTLEALPTYLDILPLYVLLLAAFPLIRVGLTRSVAASLCASLALYLAANALHWDLPSFVEPQAPTAWYFNPFTWQLVFVCGAVFAVAASRQAEGRLKTPPKLLLLACWAYLGVAFLAVDAWRLWPSPFGADFPSLQAPFAIFGNEPKSFVTPWRLCHVLALMVVALTSNRLIRLAASRWLAPVVACGRQSLYVFATGCILALVGRLLFKTFGVTLVSGILVNDLGLGAMLATGVVLDRGGRKQEPSNPLPGEAALRLDQPGLTR